MSGPHFERAEYESRVARLRSVMADQGVDLFIADHNELLGYLFGHMNSETRYRCGLVPATGEPWLVVRRLDVEPFRQRAWVARIVGFDDIDDPYAAVARTIDEAGLATARIGVDFRSYGFTAHTRARLDDLLPAATFVNLDEVSDTVRAVKSSAEVAAIATAARIADGTMAAIAATMDAGMTPRDAVAITAAKQVRLGADNGLTGPTVKSAGPSGFLHGHTSDDPLGPGDVLHVELVPRYLGYSARLMRPIVIGAPGPELRDDARRIVAIQDRQIAAMKVGARASEVDAILRDGFLAGGLRGRFENATGYTLGLYGRTPRTSDFSRVFLPTSGWRLEAGMVFHMYASALGLAFSETVVVETSGPRLLTGSPRRVFMSGPDCGPDG